jgi:mannose-6-phosphate isomerase
VKPEPFRIEPIFTPRIWGARSLAPLFPEKTNLQEPIGEVWLTGVDCRVASGPFAGKTLGEAWREMPAEWRGARFTKPSDFPILIKFIFPNNKLSIQVHPDDAYAAAHEQAAGGRGKTEMWYVVSAEPGAKVLVGFKPGVSKEAFLKALASHTLEDLFEAHTVHAGDTFFVPARTPHTIGPGIVICEVQEYSDLTYRVYDYGRVDSFGKPRELHIEKALAVTEFNGTKSALVSPLQWSTVEFSNSFLVACPYFATERWEVRQAIPVPHLALQFDLFVFLSGKGKLQWEDREMQYQQGECWLLPSSLESYRLVPSAHTSLIHTLVPDLKKVRENIRIFGFTDTRISQVLFE